MLYMYSVWYGFYDTDEEIKEKEAMEKRMRSCKELKLYRNDDDCDGSIYFISELDSVVIDGIKINAKKTLSDFVKEYEWNETVFEIESTWFDTTLRMLDGNAVALLSDDLKAEWSEYEDEIYNADVPEDKVRKAIIELSIVSFELAIEELQRKYKIINDKYNKGELKYYETI